ncbi:MAG: glycosyltransferase [Myxococcales bacterium FL481]|nr:MAG: glycosyltransferase [Myxococcales bacterium FL481]
MTARRESQRSTAQPTVEVLIPLFNEGRSIYDTVLSLLSQKYPTDRLTITVIDDASTDDSFAWAEKARAEHPTRVRVLRNVKNLGKRRGLNRAVRASCAEIVVSVDSDVVVHEDAVARLVSGFTRPEIAAVGGRVGVCNPHDSWLTRMQVIKYHFGYYYLKNLERAFESVMCLSGCLTAYRREVLLELEPVLEDRRVLGVGVFYGEDRYLTRQIVKAGYATRLVLDARCWTKAPITLRHYFSQQLRWRRSNLVDFLHGVTHVWRLHPIMTLHYVSQYSLQLAYPLIIVLNVLAGAFWELAFLHLFILTGLGVLYWFECDDPPDQRVHPLSFLAMGLVMPVTYLLLNVLALFTLDSGSWETRGHQPAAPLPPTSPDPASTADAVPSAQSVALSVAPRN